MPYKIEKRIHMTTPLLQSIITYGAYAMSSLIPARGNPTERDELTHWEESRWKTSKAFSLTN
jgi:hypothetical protein